MKAHGTKAQVWLALWRDISCDGWLLLQVEIPQKVVYCIEKYIECSTFVKASRSETGEIKGNSGISYRTYVYVRPHVQYITHHVDDCNDVIIGANSGINCENKVCTENDICIHVSEGFTQ